MKYKQVILSLFLALTFSTVAMEAYKSPEEYSHPHGNTLRADKINLLRLPEELILAITSSLRGQDRIKLFSTHPAFNVYGLRVYYPWKYPLLKEIHWYKMGFLTDADQVRFNRLLFCNLSKFIVLQNHRGLEYFYEQTSSLNNPNIFHDLSKFLLDDEQKELYPYDAQRIEILKQNILKLSLNILNKIKEAQENYKYNEYSQALVDDIYLYHTCQTKKKKYPLKNAFKTAKPHPPYFLIKMDHGLC